MNKRIYEILKNDINTYPSSVSFDTRGNGAIFEIFNDYFQKINIKDEAYKNSSVELKYILYQTFQISDFELGGMSLDVYGITFIISFDNVDYNINFKNWKDGPDFFYRISITSELEVNYSGEFIYKYLLYNALENSKLKGSYFTMPRDSFSWNIKTMELRTFDDVYLPTELTNDLKLYVDIFKKSDRILRYLKVGNPGVGKTEATIVLASELKKLGVTIIKTSICDRLHDKVELANVLEPSLIIFDDIDLSLGDRNKGAYSRLLGDFLDVLDGTDKLSRKVGIIATTNAAHLLDLAAQRPGRFDKILLFDNITKSNIKNIILKSLRTNFELTKGNEIAIYSDVKIVKLFYDAGVTGSHIYNTIKMLKLRYDTLGIEVTTEKIVESIVNEITVIDKIRKISILKDRLERGNGKMGFNSNQDDDDDCKAEVVSPSEEEMVEEKTHYKKQNKE